MEDDLLRFYLEELSGVDLDNLKEEDIEKLCTGLKEIKKRLDLLGSIVSGKIGEKFPDTNTIDRIKLLDFLQGQTVSLNRSCGYLSSTNTNDLWNI